MRVLCPIISGSGVEVYHHRLACGLSSAGVQTEIVKLSPSWEYFPWGMSLVLRGTAAWKREFALIHANVEYGSMLSRKGKPLVVTLHHCSIDREALASLPTAVRWHHQLFLKPSVEKTLQRAEKLVAVSDHTKTAFCRLFNQELPIQVIYNGIDTHHYSPVASPSHLGNERSPFASEEAAGEVRSVSPEKGKIVLFFSGNPSYRKGYDLFEPVMRRLGEDFVLRYAVGLRQQSSIPFQSRNVQCLGTLTEAELIREIQGADIAFQPSRREGFGLSILEAMACGKPIVSSNISAIPEVLDHGKGGYLCEAGSVDQFVSAIQKLAQSAELRSQMGEHNRRSALKRFALERMAQEYYQLYKEFFIRISGS